MSKKRNNIGALSDEQRAALGKYAADLQRAKGPMMELAQTAKALHQAMIDAPVWHIMETPKQQDISQPELWTVGHAKVNYVEHITTTESEGAQ